MTPNGQVRAHDQAMRPTVQAGHEGPIPFAHLRPAEAGRRGIWRCIALPSRVPVGVVPAEVRVAALAATGIPPRGFLESRTSAAAAKNPERPRPGERGSHPAPDARRQHFSVNAGETPDGPPLRRVASLSYPGVGTEAGIAPCPASDQVAVGARRADSPRSGDRGLPRSLTERARGPGRFQVRSWQSFLAADGGDVGRYAVQVDLLRGFDCGPRL
jgi:hypothetical protein